MRIRIGYDMVFESSMATPTILMLSVHPSRINDLMEPHGITFDPPIPAQSYTRSFWKYLHPDCRAAGSACRFKR